MTVSFVIPCWDDVQRLRRALELLSPLEPVPEIVVADASRERGLVRGVVEEFAARYVAVGEPNRGGQLNAGARAASGDVLVFHHADTGFSQAHLKALTGALAADENLVGGAFYKDIRAHHPKVGWSEPVVRL